MSDEVSLQSRVERLEERVSELEQSRKPAVGYPIEELKIMWDHENLPVKHAVRQILIHIAHMQDENKAIVERSTGLEQRMIDLERQAAP